MYPDPSELAADVDRLIAQHEKELAELEASLPTNHLAWSTDDHVMIIKKKSEIGYLRNHGKTNALIEYSYSLLKEVMEYKHANLRSSMQKNRTHLSRIKKAEKDHRLALLTAYEIASKSPALYKSGGKNSHLAKLVCKRLGWAEKRERKVRRYIGEAKIADYLE